MAASMYNVHMYNELGTLYGIVCMYAYVRVCVCIGVCVCVCVRDRG